MRKKINKLGILGGTFDPVHNGHLYIAQQALSQLTLDAVQFLPCHIPPHHKNPAASALQRLAMLTLAIKDCANFTINDIELKRATPSYTIDTLKLIQQPQQCLYFIMGLDSFLQFHHWQQWQQILNYCHLVIVNRENYIMNKNHPLESFYQQHHTCDLNKLTQQNHGCIYSLTVNPSPISSSGIRNCIYNDQIKQQLPPAVNDYMIKNKLYLI